MEKLDPRAQRSRKWMQEALMDLLQEKDFEKISITDITERAGLSRPTFYLHYKTKEDIIAEYFYEIFRETFDEYVKLWKQKKYYQPAVNAYIKIFEGILEQQQLFKIIIQTNQQHLIYKNSKRYSLEYLKNMVKVYNLQHPAEVIEMLARSLAGSSTALIVEWLLDSNRITPAQMGETCVKLIQPTLNAVMHKDLLKDTFS